MMLRAVLLALALGVTTVAAQTDDGLIAGRITDKSGGPLPGARITITSGAQSRVAVTDSDGQFTLRSLTMGAYHVAAELAGFTSISGEIPLNPSSPRVHLAWSMEIGCIVDGDLRVIYRAREAASLVDAILHVRVISDDGPVLMSVRPGCTGPLLREYSVKVLGSAPARDRANTGQRQVFRPANDARLQPAQEYLVLLWPDGRATDDLVLPIVSGLVASPKAGELSGMRVDAALKRLELWSQEKRR